MKTGAVALILNEGLHPVTMDTGCPLSGEGHSMFLPAFYLKHSQDKGHEKSKGSLQEARKKGGGGQPKQTLQQAVEMEPYRRHVSI